MTDFVDKLSDAELRTKLAEFGFPILPITTTTRGLMVKKLKMLIENRNKLNNEGRRSLSKYSSEEESDDEVKVKKDKNRRMTVGVAMRPPAPASPSAAKQVTRRSSRKLDATLPSGAGEALSDVSPISVTTSPTLPTSTSTTVFTETKTRKTTKLVKPVTDADMDTGSDSEPEIIDEYIKTSTSESTRSNVTVPSEPVSTSSTSRYWSSYLSPRLSINSSGIQSPPTNTSTRYTTYSSDPPLSSPTSKQDSSSDRLNQIRSRLSMGSALDRKHEVGGNDFEAPYLSNFSKRLTALSSSSPKVDYYKNNDIIKEHDANGSSYNRSYLSRVRNRDYPQDFKSSQEKNIFKNNFVSFALLAIVVVFFVGITLLYVGIKDQSPVSDRDGYKLPLCENMKIGQKPTINCIQDDAVTDAINLMKVLLPELNKRAVQHFCSDSYILPYMSDEHIIDFVSNNYALKDPYEIQKAIHNLQVLIFSNPKWGLSVIRIDKYLADSTALQSLDEVNSDRSRRNLAVSVLNPVLPWKCVIFNKLYTIMSSLIVISVGLCSVFLIQKAYKYFLNQKKVRTQKIYSMVEKIIDILQSNAADNPENYLAVNHVRDMLIPPYDRKAMTSIWNEAVKFLSENESRIRTEVQIVAGEEFHVWRWVGAKLNTSSSSPRSRSWQGQAFETQVGSVNSLQCSPTPCLKIRGMFDERERNVFNVREAVLGKCASKCNIIHCEVDVNVGCVYLKCANQAEAAIAYQNLHGWWYDGRLVTVKYLKLERYMQRFPDSPTRGPPYLTASTSQSVENDWSVTDN